MMFNKYLTSFLPALALGFSGVILQAETDSQWRARALSLQAHIDHDVSLSQATFIGTHNSFNNEADGYVVPNHKKNITDQLNGGVRMINFDVHYGFGEPRLCHGLAGIGCGTGDTTFKEGLTELNNWLNSHSGDVVILVLEDKFTGPDHYRDAIDDVEDVLDEKIYGLANQQCNMLNIGTVSKQDILNDGKQLVILENRSDCGASDAGSHSNNWFQYVWKVSFDPVKGPGNVFTNNHQNYINGCTTHATRPSGKWAQMYEDRAGISGLNDQLSSSELNDLMNKCNVATYGLDMFINVDRRDDLIWSWSKSGKQPSNSGGNQDCAAYGYSNSRKWDDQSCSNIYGYTCHNSATNSWETSLAAGVWNAVKAEFACISEFGLDYSFAVPRNAGQNGRLADANPSNQQVWINYSDRQQEGSWRSTNARSSVISLLVD